MNFDAFLKSISKIEHLELPGIASQVKMSPPHRLKLIEKQKEAMKNATNAGVMALFYPDETQSTKLILILRKTYKGVHSAQVGFPGGKFEHGDVSIKHTALRETQEEIGVAIEDISILKEMTSMYIPPSNFNVHPFVGVINKTPKFMKQEDEVEDLIEVALSHLIDDSILITTSVPTSYEIRVDVPAFKLNGHIVWGATAMMLSELKDLLKRVL
ncbi:coenzyme A pyrophosphatase [Flavobacteriales bacterium 34_180_T64]|nr:coenzyme A pyrophosphatase [Flavobacteriales bacterium 34_180_T64]